MHHAHGRPPRRPLGHPPRPRRRRAARIAVAAATTLTLTLLPSQPLEAQATSWNGFEIPPPPPPPPNISTNPERYWPSWRGPLHNGVSPYGNPPVTWSEGSNVRWKVPVPGRGLASPVVWNDKVFVLTAVPIVPDAARTLQAAEAESDDGPQTTAPVMHRFLVIALSRADGSVLWQQTAVEQVPHESHYIDSSYASASPVTDGKRLIAHFGSQGTYAYDLDGKLLWKTDLGDMTTRRGFGEGSSPALVDEILFINWDHEGDSFLVALDAATGEQLWKVERPGEVTSWATPLVVEHGNRKQVVVAATGMSRSYDFRNGKELWHLGGMTTNVIPSPVSQGDIVYLMSGFRGSVLQAVSLARAKGDVLGTKALLWTHDRHTPYVPSPLLYENHIYFVKGFSNIFSNLDATTGRVHFSEQRLPGIESVYASPVAAAGRIYVFDRLGHAVVLKHGDPFEVLAENDLDEGVDASPAIVDNELFVRTRDHLYCLTAAAATGPAAVEGIEP